MADETPEQQIASLTARVSDLTATNTDLAGQLAGRTRDLREVRHKATFKELALEAGVRPKSINTLYRESGYDPGDQDEADPAAVKALIESGRDEYDFCFEPAELIPPAVVPKVAPVARVAALGSSRGKAAVVDDKFRVSLADTRNPAWLAANKAKYAEAGKNGTLEIIDMS